MDRWRRFHHGITDSTNERAFAALAEGSARHGDTHVAFAQETGRGRHGRTWVSPEGEGLYMSLVLLPPEPVSPAALTVAAGLAVLDAVHAIGLARAEMKWPNDVLLDDAKLAGVLVETRGLTQASPHYVVGIGVNVAQRSFPADLTAQRKVTSLALEGLTISVQDAENAVRAQLERRLAEIEQAPDRLAQDYLSATRLGGHEVRVETADGQRTGRLIALSFDEGVRLREASGAEATLRLEFVRGLERE